MSDLRRDAATADDGPWRSSIYQKLHGLAERALAREAPGHSLQPTMLVHDAYLRLIEQRNVCLDNRSQVMAVGANIIRRLLVDYARRRKRLRRGGANGRGIPLQVSLVDDAKTIDVLELNDALDSLREHHARAAAVVEFRFFGGMTQTEIAEHLGVSVRTVRSDWTFAKAWLYEELGA